MKKLHLTFTHRYQDALVGTLSLTDQDTPELTASSIHKTVGLVVLAHSTPIMYQRQPYTMHGEYNLAYGHTDGFPFCLQVKVNRKRVNLVPLRSLLNPNSNEAPALRLFRYSKDGEVDLMSRDDYEMRIADIRLFGVNSITVNSQADVAEVPEDFYDHSNDPKVIRNNGLDDLEW